jgi:solute carrier family 25 (mitochondrial carnitine/acylcarnitine transporter), member 20/29
VAKQSLIDLSRLLPGNKLIEAITMEKGSFLKEFIGGNVGGLIGICVVYPLDTAKIRMQTYPHYKGIRDVITSMVKNDGIHSLYRGIPSPALGFGLTFAVSFR